jgi:hypothetical protein
MGEPRVDPSALVRAALRARGRLEPVHLARVRAEVTGREAQPRRGGAGAELSAPQQSDVRGLEGLGRGRSQHPILAQRTPAGVGPTPGRRGRSDQLMAASGSV